MLLTKRLLLAIFFGLAVLPAAGGEATYQFGSKVAAGDVYRLRLTDLPQGTQLSIKVETSAPARYLLMPEEEVLRFPDFEYALLDAVITVPISFLLTIDVGGNFFLLVDNRNGVSAVDFAFDIRASL